MRSRATRIIIIVACSVDAVAVVTVESLRNRFLCNIFPVIEYYYAFVVFGRRRNRKSDKNFIEIGNNTDMETTWYSATDDDDYYCARDESGFMLGMSVSINTTFIHLLGRVNEKKFKKTF